MACRRELLEAPIGSAETLFCPFQVILREESLAKSELRGADFAEIVDAAVEELERLPRAPLGGAEVAGAEIHLGERADELTGVGRVAAVEGGEFLFEPVVGGLAAAPAGEP